MKTEKRKKIYIEKSIDFCVFINNQSPIFIIRNTTKIIFRTVGVQ